MLRFEHPDYLWFLLSLPVLAAGFVALHLWRKKLLSLFIGTKLTDQLAPDLSTAKRTIKQGLLLGAVGFLILAVANPQVGTRLEEVKREGIDLFVVLDVSLSMKAEDIRPSRLEKAKRDVSELLRKLSGDRVGLIVFAGEAFVQFPLTSDYEAADLFISAVDVDVVPTPGTMIGSGIDVALKSFSTDLPTQKAIIVVSDGENTEGDVLGAVEDAKKAGVKIYTVGMGTPEGGPIPVYGQEGSKTDFKRDQSNSIVLTKLDESMLQQIASTSGGTYHRATSAGNEIDDIFKEVSSLQKTEFAAKQLTGFESRYQYPLAFALFLLFLETMMSERKGKLMGRLKNLIPAAGLLLFTFAAGSAASAQTLRGLVQDGNKVYEKGKFPDAEAQYKKALEKDAKSREAKFNLGDAYYKQQRYDEAMKEFGSSALATKSPEDQAAALYNIGNSLYRAEKYQESIDAYKQALRMKSSDDDIRYNLEMARAKLKQQQQQKKDQNKKNDKQNKDQQQKQNQQNQDQQNKQQPPQNQQSKQDQTQQAQKKNQMPKQEADRILEALRNNEKEIQKQLHKRPAVRVKVEKDW